MKSKRRVLYVVDSVFWITGVMADEMARSTSDNDSIVCSFSALQQVLAENGGRFPVDVDLVHFLITSYGNAEQSKFRDRAAVAGAILHVEDETNLLPLEYADAVMTMSDQWQTELSGKSSDPGKVVKVAVGIEVETFRPARSDAQKRSIRRKYGIPDDAFVVGFSAKRSSNTSDRKGVDVLEKLIKQSREANDTIWWVVRGPGWEDWVAPLREQGASITYLPFLLPGRELADSYRMLDAFVVTSRIEGGPIPLLEAMSAGLPCISTPVGYALEAVRDGENGFLVSFGDASAFMEKLRLLQGDRALCRALGAAARRTMMEQFTWPHVLKSLPELHAKALDNFARRAPEAGRQVRSDKKSFAATKKRIELLNYEFATTELRRIGATKGAQYCATLGLLRDPLSPSNFRRFVFWSYLGVPYFGIMRFLRRLRKGVPRAEHHL